MQIDMDYREAERVLLENASIETTLRKLGFVKPKYPDHIEEFLKWMPKYNRKYDNLVTYCINSIVENSTEKTIRIDKISEETVKSLVAKSTLEKNALKYYNKIVQSINMYNKKKDLMVKLSELDIPGELRKWCLNKSIKMVTIEKMLPLITEYKEPVLIDKSGYYHRCDKMFGYFINQEYNGYRIVESTPQSDSQFNKLDTFDSMCHDLFENGYPFEESTYTTSKLDKLREEIRGNLSLLYTDSVSLKFTPFVLVITETSDLYNKLYTDFMS